MGPWERAVLEWLARFRPHAMTADQVAPDAVRAALEECRAVDLRGPAVSAHQARKERCCRSCGALIAPGQRYYRVARRPDFYAPHWRESRWRLICASCAVRFHLVAVAYAELGTQVDWVQVRSEQVYLLTPAERG